MFASFKNDESGATAIEYGLIAALIAVGLIGGATAVGERVFDTFDTTAGVMKDSTPQTSDNGISS